MLTKSEKTRIEFENRAWAEAGFKRLVSNRVDIPISLGYQFPYATSIALEIHPHAMYNGDYVITAYAYSAPEKRPGKIDPCFGGLVKASHYQEETISFKTWMEALEYLKRFNLEAVYGE